MYAHKRGQHTLDRHGRVKQTATRVVIAQACVLLPTRPEYNNAIPNDSQCPVPPMLCQTRLAKECIKSRIERNPNNTTERSPGLMRGDSEKARARKSRKSKEGGVYVKGLADCGRPSTSHHRLHQSSQMVSRSRSPRRSAPQTLHLFRLSLEPKLMVRPRVGTSRLPLPLESGPSPPSAASAAAFSWAIRSASRAASSASGESGIVSRLEMLGLLDLVDVGVEGTDDRFPP